MTKKEERRNYLTSLRILVSITTADLNTIYKKPLEYGTKLAAVV
jgi:hypothetical protein